MALLIVLAGTTSPAAAEDIGIITFLPVAPNTASLPGPISQPDGRRYLHDSDFQPWRAGAGIEDDSLFFDLIFSSTSVQFTAVPPSCVAISSSRFRCAITNAASFAQGGSVVFSATYRNLAGPFGTPPFVVQTSYNIEDGDFGNNTYGFAVFPQ